MAAGRGRGGASRSGSNHPALACASTAPPCPRRGLFVVNCHVLVLSNSVLSFDDKAVLLQDRTPLSGQQKLNKLPASFRLLAAA